MLPDFAQIVSEVASDTALPLTNELPLHLNVVWIDLLVIVMLLKQ